MDVSCFVSPLVILCGLTSPELLGSVCASEDDLVGLILTPAANASQGTQTSLADRSKLAMAWRTCREAITKSADLTTDVSVTPDKRQLLLDAFQRKYNFFLELFHQPSDSTLILLVKMHAKRSADFIPLIRVANLEEGRDFRADTSTRAKIGKEIMLVLENSEWGSRKSSDHFASGEAFARAVRILGFVYALVSAADEDASCWFDLQAAFVRLAKVEKLVKLGSKRGFCF